MEINNNLLKWGATIPFVFAGVVWAVDARIEQKTHGQIQQLRQDVVKDFRQERINFLKMKDKAGIITDEERIELNYLLER